MKIRSFNLVSAFLLVLILLTFMLGCSGGGTNPNAKGITVQNVGESVQTALQNLHSYEMDMQIDMNVSGSADGQIIAMKMSGKANGAVDLEAKKSGIEMALSIKGSAGTEKVNETTKTSSYIIEDTVYTGTSDESGKMTWTSQAAPSDTWEQEQQTEQLLSLLNSSNIKYLKSEKVQGTQCFLVELTPDPSLLWSVMAKQMGNLSSDIGTSDLIDALKTVTVKYWFDQDTLFFRKAYIYMDMELDAAKLGASKGNVKYVIELTMDFNKFNTNVNIQLPAEAAQS